MVETDVIGRTVGDRYSARRRRHRQHEREQRRRRRTRRRQRREHNVPAQYNRKVDPIHFEHIRWRATLLSTMGKRHKRRYKARISSQIESLDWNDAGNYMTGTLTLRDPDDVVGGEHPKIKDGDEIRLEAFWFGQWREVWVMRVEDPEEELGMGTGNVQLAEDLKLIDQGIDSYSYHKAKKGGHKKGWKCHEITADVCKEQKIRRGKIAKGKHDITSLRRRNASPLSVIAAAYAEERNQTGQRFVFRWHKGRLNITRLRRNRILNVFHKQIVAATSSQNRGENFFTAITVVGNIEKDNPDDKKKGKTRESVEILVHSRAAIRRYGYVHITKHVDGTLKSRHELRERGQRLLARSIATKTIDRISLTHPGIPFVRKGDATMIQLPEYGFKQRRRQPFRVFQGAFENILFVKSVSHTVQSGNYTMDIEFGLEDIVAEMDLHMQQIKDRERRKKKRERRKHRHDHNGRDQSNVYVATG